MARFGWMRRVGSILAHVLPLAMMASCSLLGPATVLGHGAGLPFIHVPADHIEPGTPFTVVAADLGESARVTLALRSNDLVVALGTAMAGPDGHFEASLVAPESFPDGYAQLTAEGDDGSRASVWVRVGEAPGLGPPSVPVWAAWRIDSPIVVVGAGSVLVLGLLLAVRWRRSGSIG